MFKNILLAVDGSDHSNRAAEKAVEVAKNVEGASIELLYVVDGKKSKTDVLHEGDSDTASIKREKLLQSYRAMIEDHNIQCEKTVLHGQNGVAEAIIVHANNGSYDTLVMGSRGLNNVQQMVLGGVSHKVMKYVNMPILMIK